MGNHTDRSPALKPLMTSTDVAAILGKSRSWVQRQAAAGTIGYTKVGRSVRFTEAQVAAFIDSLTVIAGAPPLDGDEAVGGDDNPWGRKTRRARRAS